MGTILASQSGMRKKSSAAKDPQQAAQVAGLTYTDAHTPGITRKRMGKTFAYFDISGKRIKDPQVISRNYPSRNFSNT